MQAIALREMIIHGARTRSALAASMLAGRADGGPLNLSCVMTRSMARLEMRLRPGWRIARFGGPTNLSYRLVGDAHR